ncbi:alanine--tRNA ligase [bacterium]|nr:alanine--tRNA ligase [bacterium]
MTSAEIRRAFIDFFREKEHRVVRSAPVVPQDDPTLLFTNAGMNQFKDVFLGTGTRDYSRAVDSQKCIRVSGKHNDLEEVGPSPNHHTFFEMLGNWSFGDYYKAEAIRWAWELMTEVYGLPKDKLHATVFTEDDEAHQLWQSETDIEPAHISRHGHKDNFWEMGEVGPCGPCTEIHIDLGKPAPGKVSPPDDGPNTDSGRFVELWNLVFIQYHRDAKGNLHDLPAKHVDTGAGLERITRVLQGVDSNYDTDLFQPLIQTVGEISGVPYGEGGILTPHRVIADHVRALSFAIADGALPGNEGRGYVLRRILRRAARFSRELGITDPFLADLVPVLVDVMGGHFDELKQRMAHIQTVLKAEEESFARTLDRGLEHFALITETLPEGGTISGEEAFKLYDTFGFPLDLTELMARERGYVVDNAGFQRAMEQAREKSRGGAKFQAADTTFDTVTQGDHSEFVGYKELTVRTSIRKARLIEGEWSDANDPDVHIKPELEVVLAMTPFYAESGGQLADTGMIHGKQLHLDVIDVQHDGDLRIHRCRAVRLPDKQGQWPDPIEAQVDTLRRRNILPHHTATHLLQAALRQILGDHVTQAGSRVGPDYMTFDFTHFERVTEEQRREAEAMVNAWIRENHPVSEEFTTIEEAKQRGAMALFGEKYGDVVRMIKIGEDERHLVSAELCGGTHADRTGDLMMFRIEGEAAVSAGVRRMTCTAGEAAWAKSMEERESLSRITELVGSRGSDPADKVEKLIGRTREMEKEIERLKKAALQGAVRFVEDWGEELDAPDDLEGGALLVSGVYEAAGDRDALQAAGDKIIDDLKKAKREGVGIVGAAVNDSFMMVCVVTPGLVKRGMKAGAIVGELAKKAGGGGGGKPNFATAGSRQIDRADALLRNRPEVRKVVQSHL